MRALVIGASGFVGSALLEEFGTEGQGTSFGHPAPGLLALDMRDATAVARCLEQTRPDVVLVPAALPHVDWCEDHEAESCSANVDGPTIVARAAQQIGASIVFFSTDYVFDGAAGPYDEDAPTHPLNVYGVHKLEAESAVLTSNERSLVVRLCGVFGVESAGKNFVMATLARARRGEPTRVPIDQWGTPTWSNDMAAAVRRHINQGTRGILHLSGADYLDRFAFGRLIADVFGFDPDLVESRTTAELNQRAPRPLRGGLKSRRVAALCSARHGLERMRDLLGSPWAKHG